MTLYEINAQIEDAIEAMLNSIDAETGEVDEEAASAVKNLQVAQKEKLDNIGAYIKNLKVEIAALKAEADALKKRAEQKNKDLEKLKAYVTDCMGAENLERFESTRVKFSFRKSETVQISDENALPLQWKREKVTFEPDKEKIKAALKDGVDVPGAEIIEKNNLQVK